MIPTFMGAHTFPYEYKNDHDGYVDFICDEILPEIANKGLARFNDVFCENGFFNADQTKAIINKGKENKIGVAGSLSNFFSLKENEFVPNPKYIPSFKQEEQNYKEAAKILKEEGADILILIFKSH